MSSQSRTLKNSTNLTGTKVWEKTMLSCSSEEIDIIESSIIENEKNFQFQHKKICFTRSKAHILLKNNAHTKGDNDLHNSKVNSSSLRLRSAKNEKHTKSDCLENRNNYLKIETPLKTPITPKCIDTDSVIKKITSSLKKTDCMPYLSKTKLRNIEQWLKYNDVEIVRTPPFANLSITSKNLENEIPLEKNKEKETHYTDSTIDSDVEDVLKAVYGDDWVKKKNNEVKCKTLPRRILREKFTPTTDLKKVAANSKQSFRRLILSGEESDLVCKDEEEFCQESSFISGVQMIDLDDSNDLSDHEKVKVLKKQMADTKEIQIRMSNELAHLNISKNKNLIPKNFPKVRDKQANSPAVTLKKKTFLASLSVSTPTSRCHPEAKYFKINFKTKKEELVRKLYKLYNSEVFENKLADDMNFSWNVKLRGTAGYCYNKRITKSTGEVLRISRIEFSTKIIDRADRLRDTMIHELCHAACWVLDGILDGHGSVWNDWATKAMNRFPELPKIRRCHNYDIVAKYIYRCTGCGYSIKRHSKSINTERKRCGYCYGILELLLNKKLKGKSEVPKFDVTRTLRTPNKFAIFVKENYHTVRSTSKSAKHAEIMKILSKKYALTKVETQQFSEES